VFAPATDATANFYRRRSLLEQQAGIDNSGEIRASEGLTIISSITLGMPTS
jgi:hypothetical protein